MKLKAERFRTAYFVNGYAINSIKFFDQNGIVVESISGYLETADRCRIDEIEIPQDEVKIKRKINFASKEAFITVLKTENLFGDRLVNLYIPFSPDDWEVWENWEVDCYDPGKENLIRTFYLKKVGAVITKKIDERETKLKPYIDLVTSIVDLSTYGDPVFSFNKMVENKEKIIEIAKRLLEE